VQSAQLTQAGEAAETNQKHALAFLLTLLLLFAQCIKNGLWGLASKPDLTGHWQCSGFVKAAGFTGLSRRPFFFFKPLKTGGEGSKLGPGHPRRARRGNTRPCDLTGTSWRHGPLRQGDSAQIELGMRKAINKTPHVLAPSTGI
jgi:hypothetical protein